MKKMLLMFVICLMFCSCAATKKWLGIGKTSAPDETKVETRAPLVLPPDFDELP